MNVEYSKQKYKEKGYTLVELSIMIGIASIILVGMMALIKAVTKSIWSGSTALSLTGQANEAMRIIGKDFNYAKASSMGNIAFNPGFENPLPLRNSPNGWEVIVSTSGVERISASEENIKGELRTLKLNASSTSAIDYYSQPFDITYTKDYIVSGWALSDNVNGSINLVKEDKTNFLAPIALPSSNSYWTHLTTTTAITGGQRGILKLSIPASSWGFSMNTNDLIDPATGGSAMNITLDDFLAYQDTLYVGGWESGCIYAYDGGTWTVSTSTYKSPPGHPWMINPHISTFCEFNGRLYAPTTSKSYDGIGHISVKDGSNPWSYFRPPPPSLPKMGMKNYQASYVIASLASYNGRLYAGNVKGNANLTALFAYDPLSNTWDPNPLRTFDNDYGISDLIVYNDGTGDKLYVGTCSGYGAMWHLPYGKGNIYEYDAITNTWINNPLLPTDSSIGAVMDFCEYNGKLFIAPDDGGICIYDGNSFRNISYIDFHTATGIWLTPFQMAVFNNRLYVTCSYDDKIYVHEGDNPLTNWSVAFDLTTVGGRDSYGLGVFRNKLFAGLREGAGFWGEAAVYVLGGNGYFDDVSVSPVKVVFSSSTAVSTETDYEYYTTKNQAKEDDLSRFDRYRLHYDQSKMELYRQRYVGPGPNDWKDDGPAPLCKNVARLTITNHNQESFDVELILEENVGEGKKKEYSLRNSFKPTVP